MITRAIRVAALAVVGLLVAGGVADAQSALDRIKERGRLVVGVKQDYRPWGFLNENGDIVGLEIDLAKDVAERLDVGIELVPVVASNRMEFLEQGKIDLVIATMGDTEKRREVVGMIEPAYYAGGTNLLAPEAAALGAWQDLAGKDVCAIQGAYYNKRVSQEYQPNLVAFAGIPEATAALQNGNCVAFLYDNTWIESQLAGDPQWADYEMPLATEDLQSWAVAVPLDQLEGPYGEFMRATVTDWHKSGQLIELNREWGIQDNPFLDEMHEKYAGS
jgi:polar amino acid transport system substrate-binding protein